MMQGSQPPRFHWTILGCGKIAHDFATALRALANTCVHTVAVSGTGGAEQRRRADAFGKAHSVAHVCYSYADALACPADAVYVATFNTTHRDLVERALRAGHNVLCEKPLGTSAAEVRSMIAAARASDRLLLEGQWTRFFPAMVRVRELIADGSIGEVRAVHADFGLQLREGVDAPRMFDRAAGGGGLLDLGIYPLAFASMCFGGAAPTAVHCGGGLTTSGVDEFATATLDYGGGRHAVVSTCMSAQTPEEWTVVGSRGSIRVHAQAHVPTALTLSNWSDAADTRAADVPTRRLAFDACLPGDAGVGYNFPGSAGLAFEAAVVQAAVARGEREVAEMPLGESLCLATTLDSCRAQLGVTFPMDAAAHQATAAPRAAAADRSLAAGLRVGVVGVGLPGRGVGWCHLMQLAETFAAPSLFAVEPHYLGAGRHSIA
jgi:dihydrodiol dehydrogenase / D-xylose 1-dehydrogenase (NADP)